MPTLCKNCDDAFKQALDKFSFTELRLAKPPKQKGVYVIRVKKKGELPKQKLLDLKLFAEQVNWNIVTKYVFSRLDRLDRIANCDIIYIGRAGKSINSNNTLKGRYGELANRHTIQFPLWLLLFLGWELEYGWCIDPNPEDFEEHLKVLYSACHDECLPALVDK